ncbi:MAG TPA: LamG-like jellyroll fold domain-containing protein [Chthoniobacteraceae bacterium]|nr:LamG-like jellyroll fold domain-containing protein [Chthoniobacteraceae bacterium]
MPILRRLLPPCLLPFATLLLVHAAAISAAAGDGTPEPVIAADFADGAPALSVGPGEKRLGRTFGAGPGKHPYSAYEGKRASILKYLHRDRDGTMVLAPQEPLSADVFGALNLASGTFSGWFRPGKVMKQGGALVSGWGFVVGTPRGKQLWTLGVRDGQKPEKAGKLYFAIPGEGLNAISKKPLEPGPGWTHLAVAWDADSGARLYVNGELAGETWSPGARQPATTPVGTPPIQRLRIEADPKGGVRDFQFFAQPLNAGGIAALYRKEKPTPAMLEPTKTNRALRLTRLGWQEGAGKGGSIVVSAGKPLQIREAAVLDAREELRPAGWLAVDGFTGSGFPWWYHGYRDTGQPRELHLKLDPAVPVNYLIGSGDFTGKLAGKGEIALKGGGGSFAQPVAAEKIGGEVTIRQDQGVLEEIHFYQVGPVEEATAGGDGVQGLVPAKENVFSPAAARHFRAGYGDVDRQWMLTPATAKASSEVQTLPALRPLHLVTARGKDDFALGAVALRLATKGQSKPLRAQVVVHDLLWPGRAFGRFDLLLEPAAEGSLSRYDLRFDLRDTLLPKGNQLWLSVTFEDDVALALGEGGSQLALVPAQDAAKAKALWRTWEWRSVRDHFESISEPRPWAAMDADPETAWWLRVYMPGYEAVDTGLRRLLAYFPGDPLFESTFQFTHPQAPDPSRSIALPENGDAPRWAVLTRECLLLYKEFVHWWIDHRQHPDGEFGHWYGDDTDLVQDWPDLALITDPDGKVRRSLGALADGVAGSYRLKDGEPLIRNGLNVRWTDALHAYEEGLNVAPHDFLLHYGDPVRFQRLLDTVSRYDGFLLKPEKEGLRTFAGEKEEGQLHWSTDRAPEGSYRQKYAYILLHAGLLSGWYHQHPETWRILEAVGRWTLARQQEPDPDWKGLAFPLMVGLQQHTGSLQWLEPYLDRDLWKNRRALVLEKQPAGYPNLFDRLPETDRAATFRATLEEPATRYASLGTENLGGGDQRYLQGWVDWKLTGDPAHLYPALEALYRRLKFTMPVNTEAGQSGDRVAIPKPLISQLYLGGVPASRNHSFYPDFAVSYEGLDDTFAAMVQENTPASLKVLLYSFETKPKEGKIITWALERGLYEVTQQPEEGEGEPVRSTVQLERGEGFGITLPPKTSWVVNVRQLKCEASGGLLADAAFAPGESRYSHGTLIVPLYNLGVAPLKEVPVRLLSQTGETLGEAIVKELPPVADWKLGRAEVRFALKARPGERFTLVADPEGRQPEITRRNNQVGVKISVE